MPADPRVEGDIDRRLDRRPTRACRRPTPRTIPDPDADLRAGRRDGPAARPDDGGLLGHGQRRPDRRATVRRDRRGHDGTGHRPDAGRRSGHDRMTRRARSSRYAAPTAIDIVDAVARRSAACPASGEHVPGRHHDRHLHRDRRQRQRCHDARSTSTSTTCPTTTASSALGRAGRRGRRRHLRGQPRPDRPGQGRPCRSTASTRERTGDAGLTVTRAAAAPGSTSPLTLSSGGRWNAAPRHGVRWPAPCHTGHAPSIDGLDGRLASRLDAARRRGDRRRKAHGQAARPQRSTPALP